MTGTVRGETINVWGGGKLVSGCEANQSNLIKVIQPLPTPPHPSQPHSSVYVSANAGAGRKIDGKQGRMWKCKDGRPQHKNKASASVKRKKVQWTEEVRGPEMRGGPARRDVVEPCLQNTMERCTLWL